MRRNAITHVTTELESLSSGVLRSSGDNGALNNGADVNPAPTVISKY